MSAWPVRLAQRMGFDVDDFEIIEVYDSTTDFSYGVASLWDGNRWVMDHGSLPHTHSDVKAIFNHMGALTTSVTPVMVFDEEQEKEYTYMIISIDVKNVPTSP